MDRDESYFLFKVALKSQVKPKKEVISENQTTINQST